MPKSIVIDPWFLWADDRRLRTPWHETVIYEVHVKGFTARNEKIPEALRGTYAGRPGGHPQVAVEMRRSTLADLQAQQAQQ